MAINKVNTTAEEQSFKFLKNQSSILHTIDTNRVTVKGVNVIVDKPKKGDVMCITRYKENGVLLDANKQKVIWIDGLSIEPTQLSQEYEPVGICFAVNDNKALVRYREENSNHWAVAKRYEIPYSSIMNDGAEHNLGVTLEGDFGEYEHNIVLAAADTASRKAFVDALNAWFLENAPNHSAELVELDTDLPAVDTSDTKDGDSYRNRVVVSVSTVSSASNYSSKPIVMQPHSFAIEEIMSMDITANKIKEASWYYKNNGFTNNFSGCCRAIYYRYIQEYQDEPTGPMTNINIVTGVSRHNSPARLVDFTDNEYCQILRDNFANYDEYFDSMMVKYPCGAGGAITEFPSGKENTYKLAGCTYLDNTTGKQEILYPAANWAASISLNAPKLGKGNWWLPSVAEMAQMMRDVTYYNSRMEWLPDELDIVNRVIYKFENSITNSDWYMIDGEEDQWTSSIFNKKFAYAYQNIGSLGVELFNTLHYISPITIYEF